MMVKYKSNNLKFWAITAISCALLVGIAVNILMTAYRYLGTTSQLPAPAAMATQSTKLTSLSLFGSTQLSKDAADVEELGLLSNTSHKVVGIVGSEKARAVIIQTGSGDVKVYRPGDQLGRNIRIEQILPFDVVLNASGVRKRLSLERAQIASDISDKAATRSNVGNKPTELTKGIGVATLDDGKKVLRIQALPAGVEALDIQENDLILNVNGRDAFTLYDDPVGYSVLLGSDTITLVLQRDDQTHSISIDTRDFFRLLNSQK